MRLKLGRTSSRHSGFTLIELLVVVIMVGVLASIAAPSWFAFANRQRARRVRNDLTQVLQQAQTDAQRLNAQRVVTISSSSPPQVTAGGFTTVLGEGESGVTLAGENSASTASTTVTFDYRGGVDNAPFVFSVTTNGNTQPVCVVVTTLLGGLAQGEGNECNVSYWATP